MQDFEILGAFYLGKQYDLKAQKASDNIILYDSKDLVTHAVCVGMTGSGKTGLCITMLEEAAMDSVPVIAIDPKGDIANLLLTFPDLAPGDFEPWINEDEARRNGKSPAEFAAAQSELWKKGLGKWGQDGERIRKMRETTELAIYTPGSSAGIQLSILKSFSAPPPEILEDGELLRERIGTTVTSLLGLLGIEADPIRSREHILLSNIINACWQAGKDLDLAALIQQIQQPPFTKVGVMDLDSFYPGKDRFELAMAINNLLASPGFSSWMEGEPLDIKNLLYTPNGKPKISIISIAHLSDAERMFMVSLLLNQVLGWMRQQSGTTSLRAILYMDEIFGYFPPIANPPSKQPLLTLLKQARAFGLGVMLATQNPVDLDYKGLSNTGTWFIGRLQTERDKARVLEGLEGASVSQGASFDRQAMEETLAGLGNRVFLMNNVHEDGPVVFETRWAMSYLRGPLTRSQIKQLTDPIRSQIGGATVAAVKAAPAASASPAGTSAGARPLLGADVMQKFLPVRSNAPDEGCTLVYSPMVVGGADIHYLDSKLGVDYPQEAVFLAPITNNTIPVDWTEATPIEIHPNDLETEPNETALFADLPSIAGKGKSFEKWGKDLVDFIFRNRTIDLLKSEYHAIYSKPDETERDFRVRLHQLVRESRDGEVEKLRQKYAPKFATLEERLRRAEAAREKEAQEAQSAKMQGWLSVGASLLGAFMGNKVASATNVRRGASALSSFSRASKQASDVGRVDETIEAIQAQMQDLDAQFQAETQALQAQSDPMNERLETIALKPKKKDINLRVIALAWTPQWRDERGDLTNAWE
ncbi:MAG: ATP-binding protein [Blastocatellia bacterium]|nr:ATP-binding protein [Blastocatellia bacterium]